MSTESTSLDPIVNNPPKDSSGTASGAICDRVLAAKRRAILRRLDALALPQLCHRIVELEAENEDLRRQLANAEDSADFWAENAKELAGENPGLMQDGRIVRLTS